MTLRAYARFTLRAVLPTLAVILAVVLGYGRVAALSGIRVISDPEHTYEQTYMFPLIPSLSSNKKGFADENNIKNIKKYTKDESLKKSKLQKQQAITKYSSLIANGVMPIGVVIYNNTPTIADFAPSRQHEQAVVSELTTNVLVATILIIMLFGGLRALFLLFDQKKRTLPLPITILPTAIALLRIIGYGVIAPLTIYAIYIQLPFSGREYGLSYLFPRLAGEYIILVLWLIFVPATLALREIRKRCAALAIPMPTRKDRAKWTWQIFLLLVVALVIWCSIVIFYRIDEYEYLTIAIVIFLAITLFAFAWLYMKIDRTHGQYHGTVSRSLTPIYAFVVIILAGIVQPILMSQ